MALPPIGTTTATSVGRDYTLGARRSLETPAGKAERLARRYIRKFGDAGRAAASNLLQASAEAKLGSSAVTPQELAGERNRVQTEMMKSALARTSVQELLNQQNQPEQPTPPGQQKSALDYLRSPMERERREREVRERM